MDEILEKITKLEAPQILVLVLCAIAFFTICYGIFSDDEDSKPKSLNTLELPEDGRAVTNYNSKMEAYGVKEEKGSSLELDFNTDLFSKDTSDTYDKEKEEKMVKLNKQIEEIKSKNQANIYNEEESKIIKDLQKEIDNEKPKAKQVIKRQSTPKKVIEVPKLTYEEKLQKARQARLGNQNEIPKNTNPIIETRVAIFRDQFIMPGELVHLVLTKSFTYNQKTYAKGTPVYAYININKSRVLFDISNIAHNPLNIEVRDIRDGRLGMYSSRAGELWKKYEAQGLNNTTESVAEEVTSNKIISNSIDAISKFFQKKRLRQNEKILLLNDQELIVTITDKKI
ncbi:MAG: conjugative transposon protein TraM [Cellulophaga sp.]